MVQVIRSDEFNEWQEGLRDRGAVFRIDVRLHRVSQGNLGDVAPVGEGVSEMRFTFGPAYRVYFIRRSVEGVDSIILLWGGDKGSQQRDIARAKEMAQEWRT